MQGGLTHKQGTLWLWHDAPNKLSADFRLKPLKVIKWRSGEDFHYLKDGFLTIIQHFWVTRPLDL